MRRVLLLAALLLRGSTEGGQDGLVADLAAGDPARARAAAAALRELGPAAHELLWSDFAAASPAARRARSRWLVDGLDPASLERAAAALDDPDAGVRTNLVRYLGRISTRPEESEARLEALLSAAASESAAPVRREILTAAAALGGERAARALARLIALWPAPERGLAARELAGLPAGGATVLELVAGAFAPRGGPVALADDALAELLESYGARLAELATGGETPRERAPLVLGLAHPSPEVRQAAARGIDELVLRLRELDQPERADRLLAALAGRDLRPQEMLVRRAVYALQHGLDPELALGAARELERTAATLPEDSGRVARQRAIYLQGVAHLAADRSEEAERELVRAAGALEALLAERADLLGAAGQERQQELLHQRALIELARALQRLAAGRALADPELFERAREAHRLELEAQLLAALAGRGEAQTLDVLIDTPLSPYRLIFARVPHSAWPAERCLDVQARLGRVLATVAPFELPGFEAVPGLAPDLADPVEDPRRASLLEEVRAARAARLLEEIRKAERELERRVLAGETPAAQEVERLTELRLARARSAVEREQGLREAYPDLRAVSWAALRLARDLREEGRTADCRRVSETTLAAIARDALDQRYTRCIELAAELRVAIGSAWTADGEGRKAEQELLLAVEKLAALEEFLAARGAPTEAVRARRSSALVSLAVNANVKLSDQHKALDYFERAYELQRDDFMDVLLACYRARSGRAQEAREVLADVPHAPRVYYNLACTYALLGESTKALDYLERELAENHQSRGARETQKAWARRDPDLLSLREDPRFEFLTAPGER